MSSTDEKVFKHPLATIALLNDTNYTCWKADCEQVLHGIEAWGIVMEEEEEPKNPKGMSKADIHGRKTYEDFTTRRAQAGTIIYGSCNPEVKTHLNQVKDPVRMGEILTEQMDTANTTVGRLTLFRQFSQLHPVPRQPISIYFLQLLNITNQLASTSEALPDMVLRNHIFTTLPEMFKISIKVLQSRADIMIHQIMSNLKECEQNEALATKPDAVSEALYSEQGGRGGGQGAFRITKSLRLVEEDEEAIVEEEDVAISTLRGGAAGAAPTPTTSKTVGRRIVITTNNHEVLIRKAETVMNAEKQDKSREIVQSDEMGVEMKMEIEAETEAAADSMAKAMEPVTEAEVDSMVQVSEKILDLKVKDLVKEMDTMDRSFLKMAPTIGNDLRGRPHSVRR